MYNKTLTLVMCFTAIIGLANCSEEQNPQPYTPIATKPIDPTVVDDDTNKSAPNDFGKGRQGLTAVVVTPRDSFNINGIKKEIETQNIAVKDFRLTVEKRRFALVGSIPQIPKGRVHIQLLSNGDPQDYSSTDSDGKTPVEFRLNFKTGKLSKKQRADGFAVQTYDLIVSASDGVTHDMFQLSVYDSEQPTYIRERFLDADDNGSRRSCKVYEAPKQASGCYPNRTRSTQEIVFFDSVTVDHYVTVEYSGGLELSVGIATLAFGVAKSITDGTSTSHGSEIHFTNCIECSSQVYRQVVDYVHVGDVFYMLVDGSTIWAGQSVLHDKQAAYEIVQTKPESKDYSCNLSSRSPVGRSPECDQLFGH